MGLFGTPRAVWDRMAFVERNLAVNTLRDQIKDGWSVLGMIDGVADEFGDETGVVSSVGATYDGAGSYFHNPGGVGPNLIVDGAKIITHGAWTDAAKAADGVTNNNANLAYGPADSAANGAAIGYDFTAPVEVGQFRIWQGRTDFADYAVSSVKVQFSDDNATWSDVVVAPLVEVNAWQTIAVPASGAHRYWRLMQNSALPRAGIDWRVQELEAMAALSPASAAIVSDAFAADGAPAVARLVLLHQPISTVTNALLSSQQADNAAWSKVGVVIASDAVAAPDGAMTGDTLTCDGVSGAQYLFQGKAVTAGTVYTYSCHLRAGSTAIAVLSEYFGLGSLGTFTLAGAGVAVAGGALSATITDAGGGWYRCTVTFLASGGTLWAGVSAGAYMPAASSASVHVWGAQLETGAVASPYVPTTSAPVTVSAVTINTDLIARVSRDGGTTWTPAVLSREGAFDASTDILTATLDLSGQPAGVAMAWRVEFGAGKSQRLHGLWMQWS